jgi:DNA replication protein DnaC
MKAMEYIRNFDTIRKQERNWFVMLGQSGSGKTMFGRAIVKALIEREGRPVRARAVKYYEMMQKLKSKSNDTDYWNLCEAYTHCELLFVDDLLKEKAVSGDLTEADTKHLFTVLDTRYEARRPTILTSECTSDRLDALDEAMYGRMRERAFAEIIFDDAASNYRKRA